MGASSEYCGSTAQAGPLSGPAAFRSAVSRAVERDDRAVVAVGEIVAGGEAVPDEGTVERGAVEGDGFGAVVRAVDGLVSDGTVTGADGLLVADKAVVAAGDPEPAVGGALVQPASASNIRAAAPRCRDLGNSRPVSA